MSDTILTAFSNPGNDTTAGWLQAFTDKPTVVDVLGGNSTQFGQQGAAAARDFPAWLLAHNRHHTGRVAVVTFSAGWAFIHALSQSPGAMGMIDSIVLLDGLHTEQNLGGLAAFASRASFGDLFDPLLLMSHSQIVPEFVSAKATNKTIMRVAKEMLTSRPEAEPIRPLPPWFSCPQHHGLPCPSPLEPIKLGNQYGRSTFTTDPIADYDNAGNAWRIEYQGNNAAIHIYIANYVQHRAWAMLADRWNAQLVA